MTVSYLHDTIFIVKRSKMDEDTTDDIDLLRQNYLEMDEAGKKKMKKVYEKILEIHVITTEVGSRIVPVASCNTDSDKRTRL